MESGTYCVLAGGERSIAGVIDGPHEKHLRTHADGQLNNTYWHFRNARRLPLSSIRQIIQRLLLPPSKNARALAGLLARRSEIYLDARPGQSLASL